MSNGEWPADPKDPRCPSCGEPVSATASYCMHCEADLPPAGFGEEPGASSAADTATTIDDAPMDEADPGMPTGDDDGSEEAAAGDAGDETGGGFLEGFGGADDPAPSPGGRAREHAGAWIDPDSLLDNVSTVAVGVGAGLVTLVLGALVAFWLLPDGFGSAALWVGLAAGAGGGLWIGRSRTVFDAARKAGYTVGGLLALVPVAVSVALSWQDPGDAFGAVFVFGLFLWPVALVVVGLGWLLGKGGVDDGGE